jgi:hypothetical protein
MSPNSEPPSRGIEHRFRDPSVDVREERIVRYILHQIRTGRHVKDIINDSYVVAHYDETGRDRLLEHPEVLKGIEEELRRQFAGYGESVVGPVVGGADQESPGRTSDDELPDL